MDNERVETGHGIIKMRSGKVYPYNNILCTYTIALAPPTGKQEVLWYGIYIVYNIYICAYIIWCKGACKFEGVNSGWCTRSVEVGGSGLRLVYDSVKVGGCKLQLAHGSVKLYERRTY